MTASEPYIWRRSPKTLEQVEQSVRTKGLYYERRGDVLDVHDPKQGWVTFFCHITTTYYRKTPTPSVRTMEVSSLASPSFLCESCRHILPVNEMEIVEAGQLQYTVCRACVQPFAAALRELGHTVHFL